MLSRDRSGSPAMEFALIAPVMFILLSESYDVTQLLIARQQVTTAAQQIVEIATELSIQPDQSTSLTVNQAYQAETAIYALMPRLRLGSDTNKFSVTLSAAVFASTPAGCTQGVDCAYVASTAWSTMLSLSTLSPRVPVVRACGVIPQVDATQQATIANLPTAGMSTVTSLVIADVTYVYEPLFSGFVLGPVTLSRTAFLPPRVGSATQYVQYDLANSTTNSSICPGFL
jgi:Flp pilus assembly protein TadG